MNPALGPATWVAEALILVLLLALLAFANPLDDVAREAWEALRAGRVERAYELSRDGWQHHPGLAAVHVAAAQRHAHPLEASHVCAQVIERIRRVWTDQRELGRTCGWQLVSTRTHPAKALLIAQLLTQSDPYDHDARGLLLAVGAMDPLPQRKWAPPQEKGSVRARRKRDLRYLYRYLRPEDGQASLLGDWLLVLPNDAGADAPSPAQARVGVHSRLYLRDHEIVLAGWRGAWSVGEGASALDRPSTHQLHGGYRLELWERTPMQLDGTWIVGKERDEAALRYRLEWLVLGTWSADTAVVTSPMGTHAALKLGWSVLFEGLARLDLRVEGQAGQGARGLVRLGLERRLGSSVLRIDGQLGRAMRPLGDRYLVKDLPGLEGSGASLSLAGQLARRVVAEARLGVVQLHAQPDAEPITAAHLGLGLTGFW